MNCKYQINGINVYKFIMPVIKSNMYIIIDGQNALMIDPNINEDAVLLLKEHDVEEILIILTHEHYDHISGVNFYKEQFTCFVIGNNNCKEMVGHPTKNMSAFFMAMFIDKTEKERELIKNQVNENYSCNVDLGFGDEMTYNFGTLTLSLRETPGHSSGSICIIINDSYIFTGDSLVDGTQIITRLPGGSKQDYKIITKPYLESLDKCIIVFPGHGEEGVMKDFVIG